ncbi:lysin A [Mycobacterium phage Bluefalcon]|uniref:Lysin A n=1 Tax=Mycobacterium phage Bluefalcon TaxID=2664224 RepID=A0A5Q2W9Z9_9CAUD|nr:endolysin [Mycobacterium phage Bluefalcon]AXC33281.1 lysin A [Mycobacterium phage Dublin]QGH75351.1 lysin A [Mycobacterium phage Bluefalcon]
MSFRTAYGNAYSENGWRMCNRDECVTVSGPYMNTAPLRRGPAEKLLGEFVRRYHQVCAPVVSPVWGWSETNDVGNSNHLSGTAVDVNAPQWPWGLRKMPADLVARINVLLDQFEGAIYWGRNWNRPDEMHFQLNWREGDAKYDRIIAKFSGGSVPVTPHVPNLPTDDSELLMRGSANVEQTRILQAGLKKVFPAYAGHLEVDGDYGPETEKAVRRFQSGSGLVADGIVGPATRAELAKYNIILKPAAPQEIIPVGKTPVVVGPADDQLNMRFNCLGGKTLVEAVAEIRDAVCGTNDKDKTGVVLK